MPRGTGGDQSLPAFPTLEGLDVAVEREPEYATTIHESVSGREDRTSWWAAPKYRYNLKFNYLRQSANEVSALLDLHAASSGSLKTFTYTDPYDGVTRDCRFSRDGLRIVRIVDGVWQCEVEIVSVKP